MANRPVGTTGGGSSRCSLLSPANGFSACAVLLMALMFSESASRAADVLEVDHIMFGDPLCAEPVVEKVFLPELATLWLQAIQRPDSELQRLAADTVVKAQKRGMTGLEAMTADLAALLDKPEAPASVRRAAMRALVILDAKAYAAQLARCASLDGLEASQIVEPALARWDYAPIRPTWRKRLEDKETPLLWRMLAMQCLATVRDTESKPFLLSDVFDARIPIQLRLTAAQSLGQICSEGLESDARKLAADKTSGKNFERMFAAILLARHDGQEATDLLRELAGDTDPSAASAAWTRLLEIDPRLVFDLAPAAVGNADVNVRRAGCRALIAKGDPDAIHKLGPLLDDSNPSLRRFVAGSLFELAKKADLREPVIAEVEAMLATDKWRGLEQAVLIAVHLDHKRVHPRLIELLAHRRMEVAVTAAWGMRRFKIPETLPAMLAHAQLQFDRLTSRQSAPHEFDLISGQHSQLFQSFGEMRYQEADGLMRKFVPKTTQFAADTRAAACWGLGYLYEGAAPDDLSRQFVERLSDIQSPMPEVGVVRRMCAVGLGRMQSKSTTETLQKFADLDGIVSPVGQACWWSLEQMTDVKRPPTPEVRRNVLGWFLQPAQ